MILFIYDFFVPIVNFNFNHIQSFNMISLFSFSNLNKVQNRRLNKNLSFVRIQKIVASVFNKYIKYFRLILYKN